MSHITKLLVVMAFLPVISNAAEQDPNEQMKIVLSCTSELESLMKKHGPEFNGMNQTQRVKSISKRLTPTCSQLFVWAMDGFPSDSAPIKGKL